MKKFLAIILVLLLTATLFTACGESEAEKAAKERLNKSLDETQARLDEERERKIQEKEQEIVNKYGEYSIAELEEILDTIEDSEEWLKLYNYIEERKENEPKTIEQSAINDFKGAVNQWIDDTQEKANFTD